MEEANAFLAVKEKTAKLKRRILNEEITNNRIGQEHSPWARVYGGCLVQYGGRA